MAILSFNFSKELLYPLLAGFFFSLRPVIFNQFNNYCTYKGTPPNFSFLFRLLIVEFGNSFNCLIEFISISKRKNDNLLSPFKSEIKKTFQKYKENPKLILMIIGLSLSSFLSIALNSYSETYWTISELTQTYSFNDCLSRFIGFIALSLLTLLFLKISIHRHHYIGLSFFVFYFLINLFHIVFLNSQISIFTHHTIIMILGTTIFECLYIVYKYLIDYHYLSPYELGGLQGLCSFLILLILNISLQSVQCSKGAGTNIFGFACDNNSNSYSDFSGSFQRLFSNGLIAVLLLFVGSVLCSTFFTMFLMLTNKYLNPTYSLFIELAYYCYTNLNLILSEENGNKYVILVSTAFVLIGILIYGEVIIIKFCDADYYAKESIKNRAQNGLKLYDEDIIEIQQNQKNFQLMDEDSIN